MLRTQLNDALKAAMIGKDERTVSTIRMINAKLKDLDIAARPSGNANGIDDAAAAGMMQGMIKQRRESIALYEKGNRPDLVKQESEEIAIIEKFLPKQMSEDEVKAAIGKVVASVGAKDVKDMGKVMAELKKTYAGQMDFAQASALVKAQLAG
jgi:uncharacterized protein YqeY